MTTPNLDDVVATTTIPSTILRAQLAAHLQQAEALLGEPVAR
jgi:hypothetical protein